MAVSIIKQLSGEVLISDFTNKVVIKELAETASLFLSNRSTDGGIWVVDEKGEEYHIPTTEVRSTQLLPSSGVIFSGDSKALYELLETDFFYNLVNPTTTPVGGVFDQLEESEDFLEQFTTSTSYQNALTLSVNLIAGRKYKFNFNYSLQVSRTNRSGLVRCYIEAPSTTETDISEMSSEMKDNTNYLPFSPWRYITASETGLYNVKLDYRCELGGTTVRIKECSIEILRKT